MICFYSKSPYDTIYYLDDTKNVNYTMSCQRNPNNIYEKQSKDLASFHYNYVSCFKCIFQKLQVSFEFFVNKTI